MTASEASLSKMEGCALGENAIQGTSHVVFTHPLVNSEGTLAVSVPSYYGLREVLSSFERAAGGAARRLLGSATSNAQGYTVPATLARVGPAP